MLLISARHPYLSQLYIIPHYRFFWYVQSVRHNFCSKPLLFQTFTSRFKKGSGRRYLSYIVVARDILMTNPAAPSSRRSCPPVCITEMHYMHLPLPMYETIADNKSSRMGWINTACSMHAQQRCIAVSGTRDCRSRPPCVKTLEGGELSATLDAMFGFIRP